MVCHKRTFDRRYCCLGTLWVMAGLVAKKTGQLAINQDKGAILIKLNASLAREAFFILFGDQCQLIKLWHNY